MAFGAENSLKASLVCVEDNILWSVGKNHRKINEKFVTLQTDL